MRRNPILTLKLTTLSSFCPEARKNGRNKTKSDNSRRPRRSLRNNSRRLRRSLRRKKVLQNKLKLNKLKQILMKMLKNRVCKNSMKNPKNLTKSQKVTKKSMSTERMRMSMT